MCQSARPVCVLVVESIVVFTSSNEQEDIVKSYELGADGYIRKPVESDQFMEALRIAGLFCVLVKEAS